MKYNTLILIEKNIIVSVLTKLNIFVSFNMLLNPNYQIIFIIDIEFKSHINLLVQTCRKNGIYV